MVVARWTPSPGFHSAHVVLKFFEDDFRGTRSSGISGVTITDVKLLFVASPSAGSVLKCFHMDWDRTQSDKDVFEYAGGSYITYKLGWVLGGREEMAQEPGSDEEATLISQVQQRVLGALKTGEPTSSTTTPRVRSDTHHVSRPG
jgi:hypothetical protein